MGSDLFMNPPPDMEPLWSKVRGVQERLDQAEQRVKELEELVQHLKEEKQQLLLKLGQQTLEGT